MNDNTTLHSGGCYCGAVRYEVRGALRGVVHCHCTMCQRLFGSAGAHSKAKKAAISIVEARGLKWFATSPRARRGFCAECGTTLFWDPAEQDAMGIVAGTLDPPTGLQSIGHIFVGEKADFMEFNDDLPRFEGSSEGRLDGDYL